MFIILDIFFPSICSVEIRKKSILKQTKPVPKAKISAEVLLEKAIDRTLNYLQPQRRLYARERTLRHAYK